MKSGTTVRGKFQSTSYVFRMRAGGSVVRGTGSSTRQLWPLSAYVKCAESHLVHPLPSLAGEANDTMAV